MLTDADGDKIKRLHEQQYSGGDILVCSGNQPTSPTGCMFLFWGVISLCWVYYMLVAAHPAGDVGNSLWFGIKFYVDGGISRILSDLANLAWT